MQIPREWKRIPPRTTAPPTTTCVQNPNGNGSCAQSNDGGGTSDSNGTDADENEGSSAAGTEDDDEETQAEESEETENDDTEEDSADNESDQDGDCLPTQAPSPHANGNCLPSDSDRRCGAAGQHFHPAEGADNSYCHSNPPTACGRSYLAHSFTNSNDHIRSSTPPCELEPTQISIGQVTKLTKLKESRPDNAYEMGDCTFDSEFSNSVHDSRQGRLVGDVTYSFRCKYVEPPDTFRGIGICFQDYTLFNLECRRFFDVSCYSASNPSQAYMRDFYHGWDGQVENLTDAENLYGDDHSCGTSDEVTIDPQTSQLTLQVNLDTFYITDPGAPNTVERIVAGWSVEAQANKPKKKRMPSPADITHWHGSWSGNWEGAVTLTDTLHFHETDGELPVLPGLAGTSSSSSPEATE